MSDKIVENSDGAIDRAVDVVRNGGLVICPTITNYVLVCDALNSTAIRRVFELKKRHRVAPLSVVAPSIDAIPEYIHIPTWFPSEALEQLLPGPVAFIFPQKHDFPIGLTCGLKTVGVTFADDQCLSLVAKKFNSPLGATSANISGQGEIRVSLEKAVADIGDGVDLIINAGPTELQFTDTDSRKAATMVDCSLGRPFLCRDGVFPIPRLQEYLPNLETSVESYYEAMRAKYPSFPNLLFDHDTLEMISPSSEA